MKKLLGTLLLLTLFGLIRLHWLARPGSEEISSSMHRLTSATGGLIMDLRSPAESLPNQQLAFWKREVDRILDEHPEDAELHAAAAMMFYDPCFMYASEALRETAKDDPNSLVSTPFDRVRSLRGDFDQEGSQLSTELIKRATELDSDDPRWWRLRAVLLWPSAMTSLKYKPLSSNWESVLQQAEEYDPGNALFSLIRASKLSESSIDYDSSGMLVVKDAEAWRRCLESTKEFIACMRLELGEPVTHGLVRLHTLSKHPKATTLESIRSRLIAERLPMLAFQLARNLLVMAEVAEELDTHDSLELLRLAESVADLTRNRSDAVTRNSNLTIKMQTVVLEELAAYEKSHGIANGSTANKLLVAERDENAFQLAVAKFAQSNGMGTKWAITNSIALSLFSGLAGPCLGIFVLSRCFANNQRRDPQFPLAALCSFGLAMTASIIFLGAGPAGLIAPQVQHWLLTAIVFLTLLLLVGGIVTRSRLRYSIRGLMIANTLVALLIAGTLHFHFGWESIGLPIEAHVEPDRLLEMAEQQTPGLGSQWMQGPQWLGSTIMHWLSHDGPRWSVAIFLLFAGIPMIWGTDFARNFGELVSVTACLTLLCLNIWVWTEPINHANTRPTQLRLETYLHSIDDYYKPLEDEIALARTRS